MAGPSLLYKKQDLGPNWRNWLTSPEAQLIHCAAYWIKYVYAGYPVTLLRPCWVRYQRLPTWAQHPTKRLPAFLKFYGGKYTLKVDFSYDFFWITGSSFNGEISEKRRSRSRDLPKRIGTLVRVVAVLYIGVFHAEAGSRRGLLQQQQPEQH